MNARIVCTIVTKNYLAFARALAISLTEHNPDIKLYVLLADRVDEYFDPAKEPFEVIRLEELPDQQTVQRMCFYYTPFELCCALRGMLHEFIYENKLAHSWLFLDSDILIYNSLTEIFQQLETTSILLNPHLVAPIDHPNYDALEVRMLVSGIYNGGFIGLKRTDTTKNFIKWYKNRLTQYSFQRRGEGELNLLTADQSWLNLIPTFFPETVSLKHLGVNVGYWSLISHPVYQHENTYFIDDKPVIFIHFTGWNIFQPSIASRYLPLEKSTNIWEKIGTNYKKILLECGYENCKKYPYAFEAFNNKRKITLEMRYFYYESVYLYSDDLKLQELNPFCNYEYLNLMKKKNKVDRMFRNVLKIYQYDYLNAKFFQKSRESIKYEVLQKLSRIYEKIIPI
ncbi:hypothetical protein [Halotia branconii]|uniref:Uncharacterized protein n=1 Tax=Halotia branconii CENA392 TaxID=1539056 RepID=A0AAJ6NP98_9CYAN|nr:hypothetical protein [Halotia branconii]WGV24082.1 hypothetical protein QI031_20050 [Halotia branconii CENA392]